MLIAACMGLPVYRETTSASTCIHVTPHGNCIAGVNLGPLDELPLYSCIFAIGIILSSYVFAEVLAKIPLVN